MNARIRRVGVALVALFVVLAGQLTRSCGDHDLSDAGLPGGAR